MSALLASIQGGARLRATKTVDKSGPALSGKVIGDTAPPAHINLAASQPAESPSPPLAAYKSPEPIPADVADDGRAGAGSKADHRQSVDWMNVRAATDAGLAASGFAPQMPAMAEAEEEDEYDKVYGGSAPPPAAAPAPAPAAVPAIQIEEAAADGVAELMNDVDKSIQHRVRSLYAYQGEGPEDLSFAENVILLANPSKTGGDWWFGSLVRGGKSGLFPKTYVDIVEPVKAKALYEYAPANPDELPLREGETVSVVDTTDAEWWKAEKEGQVLVVPAAYLELEG